MRQIHRQRPGGLSRGIAIGSSRAEPTRRTRPSGGAQARLRSGCEGSTRRVAGGAAAQPPTARLPFPHATAVHSGVNLRRRRYVGRAAAAPCGLRCCSRALPAHCARSPARSARQPCIARHAQQVQPASCAAATHNEVSTSDLMWSKWRCGREGTRCWSWHARYARANAVRCCAGGEVCKVHNAPANLAGKTSYDGMRSQASGDSHRDALGPPAATVASLGRGRSGLSVPDPPKRRWPHGPQARLDGGVINLHEVC